MPKTKKFAGRVDRKHYRSKPTSHGRLMDILASLDYRRTTADEHNYAFCSAVDDNIVFLRKLPRSTPARWHDIAGIRTQLDWRGQMTAAEFDALLNKPATTKGTPAR
jgi:hypothetical protein